MLEKNKVPEKCAEVLMDLIALQFYDGLKAAGTPDKVSPYHDLPGHIREDVKPANWAWICDGEKWGPNCELYHQVRPPNPG